MIAQSPAPAVGQHGWPLLGPVLVFAILMLAWDAVEVGRNDAANIINAVYGARLMTRQRAARIAGMATIIGALLGSGVIETARKGIFKPSALGPEEVLAIYASVYVVDTVLLYGYSAFGMPVSTTASLVFALLGASFAMSVVRSYEGVVQWAKAGTVVSAIVISIFLSGLASFFLQRVARGVIRDRWDDTRTMRLHGGWIGGGMITGLVFFLVLKGASQAWGVRHFKLGIDQFDAWLRLTLFGDAAAGPSLGTAIVLFSVWLLFGGAIVHLVRRHGERAAKLIFPVIAVLGMICMAVAFGQNDLANCASPGLATITLIANWSKGTAAATQVPIQWWMLLGCGILIFLGMRTKNATRVTRAAVRAGSQAERVNLYAPQWCLAIARLFVRKSAADTPLAPKAEPAGVGAKRHHYDPVRASTIMCVSASVIALASSYKIPVSTTYVTFAAVIGSGVGDKVFVSGDAALKIARAIWVMISWFLAALIAVVFSGIVCLVVYVSIAHGLGVTGLIVVLAVNLYLRSVFRRRGDAQNERTRKEMLKRAEADRATRNEPQSSAPATMEQDAVQLER